MTDAQRLSADVLRYHLQSYLDWAKYDDYMFPLDQFNGANIWLPNTLTVPASDPHRRRTRRTTSPGSDRSRRAWPKRSSSRSSAPRRI